MPTLVFATMLTTYIKEAYRQKIQYDNFQSIIELVDTSTDMMSAYHREKAFALGYLTFNGKIMGKELTEHQKLSDEKKLSS